VRPLADLNRNARVSLLALPVWSVFWGLVYFYSPLYMRELGLSAVDIGVVNSVGLAAALACQIAASPIANKLGRKRATLVFDALSWSVPMLLWAAARNVWFFLGAGVVNAASKVTVVSWNCLISEDEAPEKVPRIFTAVTLINSAIGVFAPVTGFFIGEFGLAPTMRVLYAAGGLAMAAMFFVRDAFVAETRAGRVLMAANAGRSLGRSVAAYLRLVAGLRRDRNFLVLALVFAATNFVAQLNVFQVVYLAERLGYPGPAIALVPCVVALANLAAFLFASPLLAKRRPESVLAGAALAAAAAAALFPLTPAGAPAAMLALMAANGAAAFILFSYREAVFMNGQREGEKADMYSAVQTVALVACVPAGYVGGLLYRAGPRLPFALAALLYLAAFGAALAYGRRRRSGLIL
jgi:predicted MFS family arabinose efflux permease